MLNIPWPGMKETLRLRVIGDTHFNYFDERDKEYAGNYARMSSVSDKKVHLPAEVPQSFFEFAVSTAKKDNIDALLLVGDIMSFPTLANVEYAKKTLDACGVPWFYISGNHDWHFEGLEGSSASLRETWVKKRLAPLYHEGADPMMYSRVIKGVRIDGRKYSDFAVLCRKNETAKVWLKTLALEGIPAYATKKQKNRLPWRQYYGRPWRNRSPKHVLESVGTGSGCFLLRIRN